MSYDQSWNTPWGWDDAEGEDGPLRVVDHTHYCPGCDKPMHCYSHGCGLPIRFRCGACAIYPAAVPPPNEPDEDGHEE